MLNQQRTFIPDRFLLTTEVLTCFLLVFFLIYIYKLLKSLDTDTVNPSEVCRKINSTKGVQCVNYVVLIVILILRGWWITGILNFPFLFYDCAQLYETTYNQDLSGIFVILFREIKIIKVKTLFFLIIFISHFWLWLTWTPPEYLRPETNWNIIKCIQVSH